ncbi:PD-(D/E)XK nuclease family protein [Brumimicrobium aurantiacum]|uniref:PD-(D/E)XK nuclease family protein n=1 Tax=Brumimicrobium aurantiacum TaxID=1737063 RepID=A0A3E1EX75_9FLAO|nr:PD-(D/E)XK nuclease family protein [Brumimicrobium aurantiacum]RFC54164.1 PD-(D/E)XK nuclease family protein [Brumimicrobium aurantiacum]
MSYFIDRIAQHIFEKELPLEHLTIVLPSQRAKKYLQRALFSTFGKPIFSPKIITMNRWVQELSPLPIIEPTHALFKLYDVHLKVDLEEPQTLDEFFKWGKTLLSDFDEMDRYLIDSKDLFRNLADIKDIENWSFNSEEELTEGQQRFMRFWDLLSDYYIEFNKKLAKDGELYMGKAYRNLATNIDTVFNEDKERKFIFAGFNALSPAEISIMKQLRNMGRADIFVDADEYYLNDKNHEAGRFIRDLFHELKVKTLPTVVNKIKTEAKNINIVNCAQSTGQAKVSATILHQDIPHHELSETLLLLADEKLVVPVMKNIPKNVGETNITLGLPLKNTAIKSWVDTIFTVQEHFQQFKSKQIYHKDFVRFIKHPFITGYCTQEELKAIAQVEKTILSKNWTFIYPQKLSLGQRITDLLEMFFKPWKADNNIDALAQIRELNQQIFQGLNNDKNAIERSILFHFDRSLVKLESVLTTFKPHLKLGTFKSLFNQHWVNESIAYYGNPLDGLQVMGLLETRLIDFKNMIVVGLNDGSMPPTNPVQTIIPMDLRKYHHLPTPREKQGLFAHHFYRLLHHVENCWITYSSADRDMGGVDEPSRYIMQLQLELSRVNPQIAFKTFDYTLSNEEEESEVLTIPKTEAVKNRLDEYFMKGTSASAMKTALRCPMDFYYKYLLGFGEEDKVEEEIEASTFGNFIHETLETLYLDFAQFDDNGNKRDNHKSLSYIDIDEMILKQKGVMKKHFYDHFNLNENQSIEGKNYLSLEIAQHLTERFLKKERKALKDNDGHLFIVGLEMELKSTLQLNIHGVEKTVNFVGYIDRIDDFDGKKRIIDYKSGKCTEADVKITKVSKKLTEEEDIVNELIKKLKSSKYAFQMLVYNMLFHDKFGHYPEKVGIISMVNLNDGPFYLNNQMTETTEELMDLFRKALTKIISDLYDDEIDFEHDAKSEYCGYCGG